VTAVKRNFSLAKVHQSTFTIIYITWCSKLPFCHSVEVMVHAGDGIEAH